MLWAKDDPPRPLMEAMRRRGVEPRLTHDAFRTMAEVVEGGSLVHSGSILVLVEPSKLRGKKAMLTSCRRYASDLRVWVYQAEAPVQLRPLDLTQLVPESPEDEGHSFGSEPGLSTGVGSGSAQGRSVSHGPRPGSPPLRLVDPDPEESLLPMNDQPLHADNPSRRRPSGLLSDEEIAMLLADDPSERKKR